MWYVKLYIEAWIIISSFHFYVTLDARFEIWESPIVYCETFIKFQFSDLLFVK